MLWPTTCARSVCIQCSCRCWLRRCGWIAEDLATLVMLRGDESGAPAWLRASARKGAKWRSPSWGREKTKGGLICGCEGFFTPPTCEKVSNLSFSLSESLSSSCLSFPLSLRFAGGEVRDVRWRRGGSDMHRLRERERGRDKGKKLSLTAEDGHGRRYEGERRRRRRENSGGGARVRRRGNDPGGRGIMTRVVTSPCRGGQY